MSGEWTAKNIFIFSSSVHTSDVPTTPGDDQQKITKINKRHARAGTASQQQFM